MHIPATKGAYPAATADMLGDAIDARFFIATATKPSEDGRILAACSDAAGLRLLRFGGCPNEIDDRHEATLDLGGGITAFADGSGDFCGRNRGRSRGIIIMPATAAGHIDSPSSDIICIEMAEATPAATAGTGRLLI